MTWQTKKLGEVLEYEQPTPYIVSSKSYSEDYETPVLTAGKSFILGKTKEKKGIFPAKDLPVIIFDDFTTATKFVDFPFKVKSSAMKILRPVKDTSDAKFLFYMMQNIDFDYTGIHKRYWISEYSKIEVPVPSLTEQKRIVKKLDEVFEKVTKAKEATEKNLQNARELFESYLQSVFANPGKDWEEKKLDELCKIQTGKWDANHATKNGKYRFYTCAYKYGFCNTKRFSGECLILPGNGVNVGEVFYYHGDFDAYQRTYVINEISIYPMFLYYHMRSFWRSRNLNKQYGSATNFLKIGNFHNYVVSFPKSIPEQKTIVKKLNELSVETEKLENIYEQKIVDLEELKKSVLQKAFTGEL